MHLLINFSIPFSQSLCYGVAMLRSNGPENPGTRNATAATDHEQFEWPLTWRHAIRPNGHPSSCPPCPLFDSPSFSPMEPSRLALLSPLTEVESLGMMMPIDDDSCLLPRGFVVAWLCGYLHGNRQ